MDSWSPWVYIPPAVILTVGDVRVEEEPGRGRGSPVGESSVGFAVDPGDEPNKSSI